jgi:hypothetical protein
VGLFGRKYRYEIGILFDIDALGSPPMVGRLTGFFSEAWIHSA